MFSFLPMWMASSFTFESEPGDARVGRPAYLDQLGGSTPRPLSRPSDFKRSTKHTSIFTIFLSRKARRGENIQKCFQYSRDTHLLKNRERGGEKGKDHFSFFICFCSRDFSFAFV